MIGELDGKDATQEMIMSKIVAAKNEEAVK